MGERASRPVDAFRERRGGLSAEMKGWVKEQARVRKALAEAMRRTSCGGWTRSGSRSREAAT